MTESRGVMHVCSLSMSPLTVVRNDLKTVEEKYNLLSEEERQNDQLLLCNFNRLRWTELSMEYNRYIQLQYVYEHLGDKGEHPKFRQVKMRPLFKAWKREVLRQNWLDIRKGIDAIAMNSRLDRKKDSFSAQRSLLAGKSLAKLGFVNQPPLIDLVDVLGPLAALDAFQTPEATNLGFANQQLDYCASTAVRTLSEAPTTETTDETEELNIEDVRQRLRKRGLVLQEDLIDGKTRRRARIQSLYSEENTKEEEKEEAAPEEQVEERGVFSKITKPSTPKQKAILALIIIVIIVLLALLGVYIYIRYKRYEAFKIAQEACKNVPRPTPRKSSWFSK